MKTAIAVHAYYPDIFKEILRRVERLPPGYRLFVTTVPEHQREISQSLDQCGRLCRLWTFENLGRDVLPFLKIFPHIQADGFEAVIKVHTKRSPHRKDGNRWLEDVLSSLLDPHCVERAAKVMAEDPSLGLVGPEGHYLPLSSYYSANEMAILRIAAELGVVPEAFSNLGFFAGTMFTARLSALEPLVSLGFTDADFEIEAGQKDGTLAHALERWLSMAPAVSNYRVSSSGNLYEPASFNGRYTYAKGRRASAGPLGRAYDHLRALERMVRRSLRGESIAP